MLRIKFKYQDQYTKPGEWSEQECVVDSIKECIELYGLDQPGVRYKIISVKEVG